MRKRIAEVAVAVLVVIAGILIVLAFFPLKDASNGEELVTTEAPVTTTTQDLAPFYAAVSGNQLEQYAATVELVAFADAYQAWLDRPKPAPTTKAPASGRTTPPGTSPPVASGSVWDRLAQCEAGGNWATHTANGFSGGLQFAYSSWTGFGGTAFAPQAWQASREQQIVVAERILASQGWRAWPACSSKLGLR